MLWFAVTLLVLWTRLGCQFASPKDGLAAHFQWHPLSQLAFGYLRRGRRFDPSWRLGDAHPAIKSCKDAPAHQNVARTVKPNMRGLPG